MDVEVAGYTYDYLVREVERQAKAHAKPAWDTIKANAKAQGISVHEAERWYVEDFEVHPLKMEASFRKGAAVGVAEALAGLTTERQSASASTSALVVDRAAAIADYLSIKHYGKTVAEREAESVERIAKWRAEEAVRQAERAKVNPGAVAKPMPKIKRWTKTDQKRLEASQRRQARAEQAEHNRYWAGVDVGSWKGGREAGRKMSVRPGIKGGES